jgi:imidazolonepropionase-like amidohydrolase
MTTPRQTDPGRPRRRWRLAGGLLAALALAACAKAEKDGVALVGGNIITGAGDPVQRDMVIVVQHGRIQTIAPREGFDIPRNLEEVDVTGLFILPGFIDGHGHVQRWALPAYLAAGVTSVRDVHGQQDTILAIREEASLGGLVAPRVFSAGAMLDGAPPTYPDATVLATATEARRAVDALAVLGVDYIKIYTHVTPELLKPLLDEASTFNLRVTAHLGLIDAVTAARLGVKSIEHMSGVPEAASPNPEKFHAEHRASFFRGWNYFERSWASLDSTALTRVAGTLAELRVAIIPTLVLHEHMSRLDDPAILTHPDIATVPDSQVVLWNVPDLKARAGWTEADFAAFRASRPNQDLFLRAFRAAGGRIIAGTDAANQLIVPGWSLHTELELLVQAGLTPADAIATATFNTAQLLGADSLGLVAPGKLADLVLLKANPLTDIRNTREVARVMIRGQLYDAASLAGN